MHAHYIIWEHTKKYECNSAWTHENEQGICHAMPMIQVKMNNRYIMYFSVYAVVARRTFISVALCSHLPQNVNDLDCASTFFPPTVPKLVSQKKKGKMLLFVCIACYQSLWASVCLLQSYSPYRRQPCLNRVTVSYSLSCGPQGRLHPAKGPLLRAPLFHQHTFSWKPRALSKLIVSELTASLQKGLNACSLIIWILVNWINCWIETVLLKMTKTQGQGEQKGD